MEETLGGTFEAELVKDLLSLITVFSAKLHGKRSKENRERTKKMKEALEKYRHGMDLDPFGNFVEPTVVRNDHCGVLLGLQ